MKISVSSNNSKYFTEYLTSYIYKLFEAIFTQNSDSLNVNFVEKICQKQFYILNSLDEYIKIQSHSIQFFQNCISP